MGASSSPFAHFLAPFGQETRMVDLLKSKSSSFASLSSETRSPECEEIFLDDKSVAHKYPRESCLTRCGGMRQPLIIPPSPQKGEHLKTIQTLWRRAANLLEEADKIVIVGYSLPDADVAAKELLRASVEEVEEFVIVTRSPRSLHSLEKKLGRESDLLVPTPFAEYVRAINS